MVCFKATPWRKSHVFGFLSVLKLENFNSSRMRNAPGFFLCYRLICSMVVLYLKCQKYTVRCAFNFTGNNPKYFENPFGRIVHSKKYLDKTICRKKPVVFFLSQLPFWKECKKNDLNETWIPPTYEFKEKVKLHTMTQVVSSGELG